MFIESAINKNSILKVKIDDKEYDYRVIEKNNDNSLVIKICFEKIYEEAVKNYKNGNREVAKSLFEESVLRNEKIVESLNYLLEFKDYDNLAKLLIDKEKFISQIDNIDIKRKIKNEKNSPYYFINQYRNLAEKEKDNLKRVYFYNKLIKEYLDEINNKSFSLNFVKNELKDLLNTVVDIYYNSKDFEKALNILTNYDGLYKEISKLESKSFEEYDISYYKKFVKVYIEIIKEKIDNAIPIDNFSHDLENYYFEYNKCFKNLDKYHLVTDDEIKIKIGYCLQIADIFYKINNSDKSIEYFEEGFNKLVFWATQKFNKFNRKSKLDDNKTLDNFIIEVYNELDKNVKFLLKDLLKNLMLKFYSDDIDKSKDLAQKLLKIVPNHKDASNILNGKFRHSIYFLKINKFIEKLIESQNPEQVLQINQINKSEEEFKKIIENKIFNFSYNIDNSLGFKTLSDRNFAIAKIIKNRGDNFSDKSFFEDYYYLSIAEGCCNYANARLYDSSDNNATKIDEARFGYLQTILFYKEMEKMGRKIKDTTSWYIAFTQYLKSFFYYYNSKKLENENIFSLYRKFRANYKELKKSDENRKFVKDTFQKYINNDIYNDNLSDDLLLKFTVGLVELLKDSDVLKEYIFEIINDNPYRDKIINCLREIIDDKENYNIKDVKDLEKYWNKVTKTYFEQKREFFALINKCIENIFEIGEAKKSFNELKNSDSQFKKILEKAKQGANEYLDRFKGIFENDVFKYNESDIYLKTEKFYEVNKSLKKIFDDVEKYPTFVYYETEWETLRQKVEEKIKEEANKLSKLVGEPKLNILAEYLSFKKDLNIIEVNFNFTNESILNLDNVEILSITTDPKYLKPVDYDGITKNFYLYNNSPSKDISLKFKVIDDSIWKEFELFFNLKISYTYRDVYYKPIRKDKYYTPLTINLNDIKNFEEIENPFKNYSDGREVSDRKMFYGRDDDIKNLVSLVINDKEHNGKCLAIYGQTRTGKTSLLNFLQKELRKKDKDDIIVSLGNIDLLSREGKIDLRAFLVRTLRLLDDEIKKNHRKLLSLLTENGISIDVDKIKDDDLLMENFDRQFGKICEFIHSMDKQIIFTIDEFTSIYDLIRKGTMTDDFMKFWKAFIQDYSVFAILICQDHMMYFVNDLRFTNAFSTTELKRITYLEEKHAKKLMYEPILDDEDNNRYTDEALDYLYNLTAGSAYLIMKLCAGLVDYLNEIRNPKITKNVIDEYLRKNIMKFGENIFESQYYDKSSDIEEQLIVAEENKKIIRKIAKNSDEKGWLHININTMSEEKKRLLNNLEARDVLIKKDGKYKIKVDLYRQWILAKEGKNNK